MKELVIALMTWISANSDLPPTEIVPTVEFVHLWNQEIRNNCPVIVCGGIYLANNIDDLKILIVNKSCNDIGKCSVPVDDLTLEQKSIVVHELVHHLQYVINPHPVYNDKRQQKIAYLQNEELSVKLQCKYLKESHASEHKVQQCNKRWKRVVRQYFKVKFKKNHE